MPFPFPFLLFLLRLICPLLPPSLQSPHTGGPANRGAFSQVVVGREALAPHTVPVARAVVMGVVLKDRTVERMVAEDGLAARVPVHDPPRRTWPPGCNRGYTVPIYVVAKPVCARPWLLFRSADDSLLLVLPSLMHIFTRAHAHCARVVAGHGRGVAVPGAISVALLPGMRGIAMVWRFRRGQDNFATEDEEHRAPCGPTPAHNDYFGGWNQASGCSSAEHG